MIAGQNRIPDYPRLLIQRKRIWQQPRVSGKYFITCRTPNFKIYVKHDSQDVVRELVSEAKVCLYRKIPAPDSIPSCKIPSCLVMPLDI